MSSMPVSRETVLELARREFRFLEEVGARRVEAAHGTLAYQLAYVTGKLTVEVGFDWRDSIVDLLLCRTVAGKPPPGYYVHEGRVMRFHLEEVLASGDRDDRDASAKLRGRFKALHRSKPPEGQEPYYWLLQQQVTAYAAALKTKLSRVLELSWQLFAADQQAG